MLIVEADATLAEFDFSCGATLAEVRQHYRVLGRPQRDPAGAITNAVLLLHGTTGSGRQFTAPSVADQLFGPGRPLDAREYYVVIPDALGHGGSSKPSDGLRGTFPRYGYGDIVSAQHRLVTEHLGIDSLRLVAGTSMGGMQTWMWGQQYPDAMRALLPIASMPQSVRGRNLLWRRIVIEVIRADPSYGGGDYGSQPRALGIAWNIFHLMTHGVAAMESVVDTVLAADNRVEQISAESLRTQDANDTLYEFAASFDYEPGDRLNEISAPLLAVNFADDEVNPEQLGVLQRAITQVQRGTAVVIPATGASDGHQSINNARLWAPYLRELLAQTAGDDETV
jgi:homoserine O-acetyltransferase/O-succinyltransferase